MSLKQNAPLIRDLSLALVVSVEWLAWLVTPILFSVASRLGHWPAWSYGPLAPVMALWGWHLCRHGRPTTHPKSRCVGFFCILAVLSGTSFIMGQMIQLLMFGE